MLLFDNSSFLGSNSIYNPYPNFKYSGKLRPFPLSDSRIVPVGVMRPDYAETGIPKSEYEMKRNSNLVKPLLAETIEKMRVVCRVKYLFIYIFHMYCFSLEERF